MFTGIVEEMGVVTGLEKSLAGATLRILAQTVLDDVSRGASLAVNGVCLTVVTVTGQEIALDVSPETLSVTTMGSLVPGAPVNLERAMKVGDRLGGHLVSGHVDGVGSVLQRRQEGDTLVLVVEAPPEILRYCVPKGSVTVDGISMTINGLQDRAFTLTVIPHTAKVTTLGVKQPGDQLNLEPDLIGKYVERLLQDRRSLPPRSAPTIDQDYLRKRGLLG